MNQIHIPVLSNEVVAQLRPAKGESYLDLTAGYGGHADKILEVTQNYKDAVLNDRDANAINYLEAKYQSEKPEITHDTFYNTALRLLESGTTFDIILADFGVSSPQLDKTERGFSFTHDARLDMRMDTQQELDAWHIVNRWSERRLAEIFVEFGEESEGRAKMLVRQITHNRPVNTTAELANLIKQRSGYSRVHPATKIFQAIRIATNDELGEITRTLPLLPKLLKPGGRVGIISFHSLEDRLVKEYFKYISEQGIESELRLLNKKPIVADSIELDINPRARSAKLRVVQKV
ncbi:MAG: 16S rRNA (cytosine(1402)-N(4))-methyltransferase RsmH [Candidatus Saccharimonadales bacterium]